jgi:hypothetical protein
MSPRLGAGPLVVALLVVAGGCGGTTYDSTLESTTTAAVTTTAAALAGSAEELLPQLLDEVEALNEVIVDKGDKAGAVERIEMLWAAMSDEVRTTRSDLYDSFQRAVDLAVEAGTRNRAADADKAERNLRALIEAYLAP